MSKLKFTIDTSETWVLLIFLLVALTYPSLMGNIVAFVIILAILAILIDKAYGYLRRKRKRRSRSSP